MLPDDILGIIFRYLNRKDRHKMKQIIPYLDEREILALEDRAAAIFMLFPAFMNNYDHNGISVYDDYEAEYTFELPRGDIHIYLVNDKNNPFLESSMKNDNLAYATLMIIDQRPKYDDLFSDNTTVTVNRNILLDDFTLESLILTKTKKLHSFREALDFTSNPFFKPLRDNINESFPEGIRMVADLM